MPVEVSSYDAGRIAISGGPGPAFLIVSREWVEQLIKALCDKGMVELNGRKLEVR